MIIRRYWVALFVISCTVSACLLLQYLRILSEIAKEIVNWQYFSAYSTDQKVNSVAIKQAAITNRTTGFDRNALCLMLPYRLDYEKRSWYQSQKFVILGADLMFRGQVLRFAPLSATNNEHREYPRRNSDNWAHI